MGVNSLPKTVTRQRGGCDLNPGATAPESSTQPLGAKLIWENNSVYTYMYECREQARRGLPFRVRRMRDEVDEVGVDWTGREVQRRRVRRRR